MKKNLVTGGAGFLGSNIINELLKKNEEVIVFDNGFRQKFSNIEEMNDRCHLIKGDITKKDDWKQVPKDVELVYHLAAINGTKYFYEIPEQVLDVNVNGTMNFVEWLHNSSVKKFFFSSSSEVYGFPKVFPTSEKEELTIPDPYNPRFSYSGSKIVGELFCINYSKKYILKN